jgi:hypothetical protein
MNSAREKIVVILVGLLSREQKVAILSHAISQKMYFNPPGGDQRVYPHCMGCSGKD